jgi:CO/xanthine dehydrogenase Mo-binding subunit
MTRANGTAWRNDGLAKVTGRAKFTDDLKLPGMLHAVPVYTDHVHARVLALATAEAEAMPGVWRVLTHRDVPGSPVHGQILRDYPMFVGDRLRSCGDVVAVVVADTRAQAIAAAAKVRVEAQDLPAVFDVEEALRPEAPRVHEERGSNIVNEHHVRRGDVEAGFAASDLILEEDFSTSPIEHAYLELETALCHLRDDGVMEVRGSMQHPFSTRRFVATLLGVPLHQVEIVSSAMGGGFGGKDDTAAVVCARAALAAKLTGRPVRMTYTREWSLRESYKRHPYRVHYRMGLSKDGIIQACRIRILADAGAYCSVTPWVTWRSTVQCCGPYTVPNVHCDTTGVFTNNVFTGAMRGFGSPQMNFIVEQLVEMAAERLGLDPIELRRRNMVKQGSTTITGQVLDDHTVSLAQVLDAVMKEIGYTEKLPNCSHGRAPEGSDELYGIGLAISYRGMSLGAEGVDVCSAEIEVQPDGSVVLETGIHENGQGAESTMVLVAAEALGLPETQVRYRRASTSTIPDSGTTVASRGTLMGGGAVTLAVNLLKERMSELLGGELGGELRFAQGRVLGATASLAWEEAIRRMYAAQRHPHALATFQAPKVDWDEHTGQGKAYFTWVYGCQAAEVSVNRQTGKVRLLNLVAAHDVGRAINRQMVLGQVYGGLTMGSGMALMEQVQMKEGRVLHKDLNTYRIPRALDLPEMTAIIVENPDPNSPSGAKGLGEPTLEITAPAIANAIYRATGQRLRALPLRPTPLQEMAHAH